MPETLPTMVLNWVLMLLRLKQNLLPGILILHYTQFKAIVDKLETGVANIFLGGFTTPNVRLVAGEEYGQIYGNAYQRDPNKGNKIIVGANGLPFDYYRRSKNWKS